MIQVKGFRTYSQQVELLRNRGMVIVDPYAAAETLEQINYYRLSGYWYPFRETSRGQGRLDSFTGNTRFEDIVALYEFDERLRTVTFDAISKVELMLRAILGYSLGQIDECAHLKPELLNSRAQDRKAEKIDGRVALSDAYRKWRKNYDSEVKRSREDFVLHHRKKYGGVLPVWAAVEVLDWGSLTYLYSFSPISVQQGIADTFDLTVPQLESWLKSLNVIRNICAHHGRLFNRVLALKPKLPLPGQSVLLQDVQGYENRTFTQLSLIQYLRAKGGLGISRLLSAVLETFPVVPGMDLSTLGAPEEWNSNPLWSRY